jgi:hypothetical protein
VNHRWLSVALFAAACSAGTSTNDLAVSSDLGASDLAAPDGGGADFAGVTVGFSAVVFGLDQSSRIVGAAVSLKELPSITATTASDGTFKLTLPPEQSLSVTVSKAGYVTTVEHPFIFHKASGGFAITMLTQSEFDQINQAGGAAAGSSIIGYNLLSLATCTASLDGTTVGVSPPQGKTVYTTPADGGLGWLPTPQATSAVQLGVTYNAYTLGAVGALAVKPLLTAGCPQAPFPIALTDTRSATGDLNVQAGLFYEAAIFFK